MSMSFDNRAADRSQGLDKQFESIVSDERKKTAYALADVVGVPLEMVDKKGPGFVQWVLDESLNNPALGRFKEHSEDIRALFDKSNPESEMLRLAHAFSAVRHERYPSWSHEKLDSSGQEPVGYLLTGQGAKDVGTRALLQAGIEAARTQRHFENLAVYVEDASGRYEGFRDRLLEKAAGHGVELPGYAAATQATLPSIVPETAPAADRRDLGKEFGLIATDPRVRTAYALADIVGVPLDVVEKRGPGFVQWVVDESLNSPLGQFSKHKEEIEAIFDKSNPEREMLRLAHAFSAVRHERYPSWEWERLDSSGQAPVGYLMTGQGAKDVGVRALLSAGIEAARTEEHFRELAIYLHSGSVSLDNLEERLIEKAAERGIDPFAGRGLKAD